MKVFLTALCLVLGLSEAVWAQTAKLTGYADFRLVGSDSEQSWTEGGLGKTQFGGYGISPQFGGAALDGSILMSAETTAYASLKLDPMLHALPELLDAYARYRPVSVSPIRFSIKAGVFFPPISLENEGIGWTSYWTLTPSAINTWVGEELRTIGSEATLEWRTDGTTLSALGSIFTSNEGAGTILSNRGWALGDNVNGLGATLRNNVDSENDFGIHRIDPFLEFDGHVGLYGGLELKDEEWGKVRLLRYDNFANPSAGNGPYAWNTDFWSLGLQTKLKDYEILAQGMTGRTIVGQPAYQSLTNFDAAYILVGRTIGTWNGQWRAAVRGDLFRTINQSTLNAYEYSEHGNALTLDLTWKPDEWLRVSLEELLISSYRGDQIAFGLSPQQTSNQVQLSVRFIY